MYIPLVSSNSLNMISFGSNNKEFYVGVTDMKELSTEDKQQLIRSIMMKDKYRLVTSLIRDDIEVEPLGCGTPINVKKSLKYLGFVKSCDLVNCIMKCFIEDAKFLDSTTISHTFKVTRRCYGPKVYSLRMCSFTGLPYAQSSLNGTLNSKQDGLYYIELVELD